MMRSVMLLRTWVAIFLTFICSPVLAISYTVQVVAVSDNQVAFDIRNQLAADGFPAYILTVPSSAGLIYRIRVGAFVNRAAAASFAAQMASVSGSTPTPALAESIPQGLIALEPELIGSFSLTTTTVQVIPWYDSVAFRVQTADEQATYYLPSGLTLRAWQLAFVSDDVVMRIHSLPLWPDDYEALSEEVRQNFRQSTIANIATELRLTPAQVTAFEFNQGRPFLVVAEELNMASGERRRLRVLGQPASEWTQNGPGLLWFSGEPEQRAAAPEPLFTVSAATARTLPQPERVTGNIFTAFADGDFGRLESAGRSWRALVGTPIWAEEDVLLTLRDNDIYLYRINVIEP
jgi:hypothetical protein